MAEESVPLTKGELLGNLELVEEDIEKIVTNTAMEIMSVEIEEDQNTEVGEVEKKFITSPADVEVHQKVNLQNAKITMKTYKYLKNCVRNMKIYFLKILLILVEHL